MINKSLKHKHEFTKRSPKLFKNSSLPVIPHHVCQELFYHRILLGSSPDHCIILDVENQSEVNIVLCRPIREEYGIVSTNQKRVLFCANQSEVSTHLVVEKEAYAHHSYGLTLVCVHWTPTLNEMKYYIKQS